MYYYIHNTVMPHTLCRTLLLTNVSRLFKGFSVIDCSLKYDLFRNLEVYVIVLLLMFLSIAVGLLVYVGNAVYL